MRASSRHTAALTVGMAALGLWLASGHAVQRAALARSVRAELGSVRAPDGAAPKSPEASTAAGLVGQRGSSWRPAGGVLPDAAPWTADEGESTDSERLEQADEAVPGASTLFLFSLARGSHGPLASARGFDRRAPRALMLWRVDERSGRSAPLARGASDSNGNIRFEHLLVPASGARLVVTAAGRSPDDPGASSALALAGSPVGAPPARVEWVSAERWRLRAYPAEGATLLVDAGGDAPLIRVSRPPSGAVLPAARGVQLEVPAPRAGMVLVAQQLSDDRVTAWRPVPPPLSATRTQLAVPSPADED